MPAEGSFLDIRGQQWLALRSRDDVPPRGTFGGDGRHTYREMARHNLRQRQHEACETNTRPIPCDNKEHERVWEADVVRDTDNQGDRQSERWPGRRAPPDGWLHTESFYGAAMQHPDESVPRRTQLTSISIGTDRDLAFRVSAWSGNWSRFFGVNLPLISMRTPTDSGATTVTGTEYDPEIDQRTWDQLTQEQRDALCSHYGSYIEQCGGRQNDKVQCVDSRCTLLQVHGVVEEGAAGTELQRRENPGGFDNVYEDVWFHGRLPRWPARRRQPQRISACIKAVFKCYRKADTMTHPGWFEEDEGSSGSDDTPIDGAKMYSRGSTGGHPLIGSALMHGVLALERRRCGCGCACKPMESGLAELTWSVNMRAANGVPRDSQFWQLAQVRHDLGASDGVASSAAREWISHILVDGGLSG